MVIFGTGETRIEGVIFLLMPVLMVVFGYLFVALSCWIYNKVAGKIGGIEFELSLALWLLLKGARFDGWADKEEAER